jgi:hypothetical protein
MKTCNGGQIKVVKSFDIPIDFLFDLSYNLVEIRYNKDMFTEKVSFDDAFPGHAGYDHSLNSIFSPSIPTQSAHSNSIPPRSSTNAMINTYYINCLSQEENVRNKLLKCEFDEYCVYYFGEDRFKEFSEYVRSKKMGLKSKLDEK